MINEKNRKGLITLGIIIVIIVLIYIFLGRPLFASTINTYKEIQDKKTQLKVVQKEVDEVSSLEKELSDLKNTMDKIENYLPEKENSSDLIASLEAAAIESGNVIQTVDFKKEESQGATQPTEQNQTSKQATQESGGQSTKATTPQLPQIAGTSSRDFEIDIIGNYASLQKFLQSVENFSRFINIASIDIASKDEAGALDTKIIIYAFFRNKQ